MRRSLVLGIAVAAVLGETGCGQSATGGVKKTAAPRDAAARPVGQAFRLTDGSGDTAQLALRAVQDPTTQEEITHRPGTRLVGLSMRLHVVAGDPGYDATPVVTGTDHHTYYAKSNSSPPDATDITVAMPRQVHVACVRDTINGDRHVAEWRVASPGC